MARINESATYVGTIEWLESGNRVALYFGENRNTGEAIVWQSLLGRSGNPGADRRSGPGISRHTGRNITKLLAELNRYLNGGELVWADRSDKVFDALLRRVDFVATKDEAIELRGKLLSERVDALRQLRFEACKRSGVGLYIEKLDARIKALDEAIAEFGP